MPLSSPVPPRQPPPTVTMAGRRGKALLDRFFRLVEQVDPFADHPWLKHGGVILSR